LVRYDLEQNSRTVILKANNNIEVEYIDNNEKKRIKFTNFHFDPLETPTYLSINNSGNKIAFTTGFDRIEKETGLKIMKPKDVAKFKRLEDVPREEFIRTREQIRSGSSIFIYDINNKLISQLIIPVKEKFKIKRQIYSKQSNSMEEKEFEANDFKINYSEINWYGENKLLYIKETNQIKQVVIYDISSKNEQIINEQTLKSLCKKYIVGDYVLQNKQGNLVSFVVELLNGKQNLAISNLDNNDIKFIDINCDLSILSWTYDNQSILFGAAELDYLNLSNNKYFSLFDLKNEFTKNIEKIALINPKINRRYISIYNLICPEQNELIFTSQNHSIFLVHIE
jgi:hypothetical protein